MASDSPVATDNRLAPVARVFAFGNSYLQKLVGDIPDEDMASQAEGVVNHPAWTLGHLAFANDFAAQMMGAESCVPESWAELFAPGTNPTPVRDDYPTKQELIEAVERVAAATTSALESVTNQRLDAETPSEMLRDVFPTVRDAVTFMLTSHVAAHLGQLAAWRSANDLPRALS